jgi:hypothetical protein
MRYSGLSSFQFSTCVCKKLKIRNRGYGGFNLGIFTGFFYLLLSRVNEKLANQQPKGVKNLLVVVVWV